MFIYKAVLAILSVLFLSVVIQLGAIRTSFAAGAESDQLKAEELLDIVDNIEQHYPHLAWRPPRKAGLNWPGNWHWRQLQPTLRPFPGICGKI